MRDKKATHREFEMGRVTELFVDISSRYKSTTIIGRIISLATKVQFTKYNNTVIHTFCVDCIAHEIYIKCLMLSFYYMRRKMINVHVNYDPMLIFHFCFPPNPSFLSLLAGFGAMLWCFYPQFLHMKEKLSCRNGTDGCCAQSRHVSDVWQ